MSMFRGSLNVERVKSDSDLCAIEAGLKPCSRRGVVTIHWNDSYPKVKACKQHAKKAGKL